MTFETERLYLRHWNTGDADNLYIYAKDPDVGPIAGWPAHKNAEESLEVIKKVLSKPECYAICLKEDSLPIGTIEIKMHGHSDMTRSEKECELGYWLGKPFWGRGIMTEAAREMIRHAFEDLGMENIWCGYYDGNERSKRVQEKCGFRYQWTTEGLDVPLMNEKRTGHANLLTKEEWKASLHDGKKRELFEKQKKMLDTFLGTGAISHEQYEKSLGDLTEKMGYSE